MNFHELWFSFSKMKGKRLRVLGRFVMSDFFKKCYTWEKIIKDIIEEHGYITVMRKEKMEKVSLEMPGRLK